MKLFFAVILLVTCFLASGQKVDSNVVNFGVNTELKTSTTIGTNPGYLDRPLSLFFTAAKNNHQLELGWQFHLPIAKSLFSSGIALQYKHYPNNYNKRFNYFLGSLIQLQWDENDINITKYDTLNNNYVDGSGTTKYTVGSIGLLHGLEFKVSDKIYVGSDTRLMYVFGKKSLTQNFLDVTLNSTPFEQKFSRYAVQIGFNAGYRF